MIYLDKCNLGELECQNVSEAILDGEISTIGEPIDVFEAALGLRLGSDVLCTNSGTAALHLALLCMKKYDYQTVHLPALTFPATANVAKYCGLKIEFHDVNPDTWLMEVDEVNDADIYMPVHLYGNPCDSAWYYQNPEAQVIWDACQALGTTINGGEDVCSLPYSAISFNANKIITTGGGGALVGVPVGGKMVYPGTNNELGILGYNYRMTGLSAAMGLAQLHRLDEFVAKKRKFNLIYRNELSKVACFQETIGEHVSPNWWYTAATFEMPADRLQYKLEENGVPTRRIFKPLPMQGVYCEPDLTKYPNSMDIYGRGLCLPVSTRCEEKDILEVCKTIKIIL